MKTGINNLGKVKTSAILFIYLLFLKQSASAGVQLVIYSSKKSSNEEDSFLIYILWAIAFLISVFILSYFKRKDEKSQALKMKRRIKKTHFERYKRHVNGFEKSNALSQ